ncbi:alpha/beta hydrolase family protein [Asticcacaulis sp. W401b]|uniref:alpha/beta hydrolase family protein n=1 Tax=Asticcacaulis sp. W401b TaxID=3388666 RepID=UPI003970BC45
MRRTTTYGFVGTLLFAFVSVYLLHTASSFGQGATIPTQEIAVEKTVKPYKIEEVRIFTKNPDVVLAGTFSKPAGQASFPAVVLLHGSGPNDRDEASAGFARRKFLVLADALNRAGIAVLRYDKRGVGKSTGNYSTASFTDFTSDAQAALHYLKTRSDVAQEHIGVLGDSEGGYIAPVLAKADDQIAFLVLVSAPALPYLDINLLQKASLARAEGASEAEISARDRFYRQVFDIVQGASDAQAARDALIVMAKPLVESGQLSRQEAENGIAGLTSPLGLELMMFDPQPYLKSLSIPVLVVQGGLDRQVPAQENLTAMRRLLSRQNATIVEMPALNHQLQKARTGAPSEYAAIAETVNADVLRLVTEWVQAQTRH